MKIAVISSGVLVCPPQGYSGLEQLAWQQAEGLAKLGHDVTLFAPNGSRCEHAKVHHFGEPGQWDEKAIYGSYWQHLLDYECVIDHSWGKWAYILKREGRLKAPVLGVLHSLVDSHFKSPPPVNNPCIVCISQDQADHYQSLFGRQARVAYNGVCPDFYQPIQGVKRSERFLFLARFSAIKGADIAIEACKRAGVGLDLVGDTNITGEPDFLKSCTSQCDGKQIRMVGPANRGECVWWFSQAKALLHPNQRFREPFGLSPVEAQMCGTPVIAWNYGALRETVSYGNQRNFGPTGFLVNSLDELVKATQVVNSTPSDQMGSMRKECRSWAMQFSLDNFIKRWEFLCTVAVETGGW